MGKYYAVRNGRNPGIYKSWDECKREVDGFKGAIYKSFTKEEEAKVFMGVMENSGIEYNEEDVLKAYVDGSYNIATGEYGYGAVLLSNDKEIELSEKGEDKELATMRNVAGEIKGAEAAMKYAIENNFKKIIIYHDYEGISKWCMGLWKTNKEGTIAYKKFYDGISDRISIEFVKVKGHSGDKYNEIADVLAKKAAGVL